MQSRVVTALALLFFLMASSGLPAQDTAPAAGDDGPADAEKAPAAPETTPPAQPGPQRAAFDRLFTQWKDILAELGTLQATYRQASEQEKAEIEKQWNQVIAKGDAMEPQLITAAEKAYAEAPNADKQLTDLLVDILLGDVVTREYASRPTITSRPCGLENCWWTTGARINGPATRPVSRRLPWETSIPPKSTSTWPRKTRCPSAAPGNRWTAS